MRVVHRSSLLVLIPILACSGATVATDERTSAGLSAVAVEREPNVLADHEGRCPTLIPHPNGPVVGGQSDSGPVPQHLDATVAQLGIDRVVDHMSFDGDCDGEVELVLLTESADGLGLWWVDREHAIDLDAAAGLEQVGRAVPQLLADGTPIVVLFDGLGVVYGRIVGESYVVLGRVAPPADLLCEHRGIGVAGRQDGRFAYFHRPTGGPAGTPCEHEFIVIDPATMTAAAGEPIPGEPDFEVLPTEPGQADVARTRALDLDRCERHVVVEEPPFLLWECGGVRFSETELELDTLTPDFVIDGSVRQNDSHPGHRTVVDRALAAPELDGLGPIDGVALIRVFVDDVPVRLDWYVFTPRPSGESGARIFLCAHDVVGSSWDARLMVSSRAMCLGTVAPRLRAKAD